MPSATRPDSRSPSPAPAPPIAEAPGPRAQGFINIFNATVDKTLEKCSSTNFASCFPTTAQYTPESLESIRGQIVQQLGHQWRTSFDGIMGNRDVVKAINSLEQCIEDAKLRKKRAEANANGGLIDTPIAPHTLSPSAIHLAHLMPFLEDQTAETNARLSTTQQANTELLSTITSQRAEIEALVRGLEGVIQDLESSAQIMGQDEVQGLSKEIKDYEMEMKRES
ncbi:Nnf1-domain-containing protein [Pleomassaria siparia CBS 279.74]|uniref:Nnf1-domain-containing protein n=1 Tax=Pleomassaria siparia CBS 279.74 TaxID=1314801 RepID=A0A6G1KAS0_9PLEO|nr:Nnf1-domain-containing protein [Pleomassaria siparia CBS 279.74]